MGERLRRRVGRQGELATVIGRSIERDHMSPGDCAAATAGGTAAPRERERRGNAPAREDGGEAGHGALDPGAARFLRRGRRGRMMVWSPGPPTRMCGAAHQEVVAVGLPVCHFFPV